MHDSLIITAIKNANEKPQKNAEIVAAVYRFSNQ